MEQLTIFDFINQFDDTKANWKLTKNGLHYVSDVLAIIPEFIPSWNELKSYIEAVHRTHDVWFAESHDIVLDHQNNKKPVVMTIIKSYKFRPEHVVEYL